ncbi:MAG: von Willebrand factor type A domain-containing protein [Bacteroidota bacterium]
MKNLKVFSLGIAMLITFVTFGQDSNTGKQSNQKTITGIVSDATGPLQGANVVVKGTKNGVQTNYDGKYSILANKGDILVFSFIGMEESKVKIGDSNIINVVLKESSVQISEVVVTAYGIRKKKAATTYSTQVVSSKNLTQSANPSAVQSLTGKVSGLQINSVANSNNNFGIRCLASVKENIYPLCIVDGVPVSSEFLSKIDPNTIQSVNVIKDKSASSLYGRQARNGAVVVITKNGTVKNLSKKELRKKLIELEKIKKETDKISISQPIEPNQEEYDNFVENAFESPKSAPLSTFSIDVDNASYTNVRRFINNGQTVPKDAVRVEEMMNFFKYNYPQPQNDNPFSINTEYSNCPWNSKHQLLKIGLQGKNIPMDNLPSSNLVFLIDVSGSMSDDNKLPLLKQSMKILVNELRKEDKVTIVVYAGAAGMVLPPTAGDKKQTIINALEKLNAGGSTAGGEGIVLAYKLAQENFIKGGNNRVILATDGDFNVGSSSDSDMVTLIEEKRKSGVFLTCLGYGMGNYKDSKLETLADKGNGNYAYIDNIQEANRFLGKEFKGSMFAIAKDVKIQIEFNPKHVQSYRLIGYENRKLRPEDFKDDAIDAGELGSGHTVTAIYEIIPTGIESKFLNTISDLKYTKVETTGNTYNDELATIKFRYKKPDGDKSIEIVNVIENKAVSLESASGDFKFTSAVAWFGLKLRDSKLISNKSTEDIENLAKQGMSSDTDGYKAEFIRLVESVN